MQKLVGRDDLMIFFPVSTYKNFIMYKVFRYTNISFFSCFRNFFYLNFSNGASYVCSFLQQVFSQRNVGKKIIHKDMDNMSYLGSYLIFKNLLLPYNRVHSFLFQLYQHYILRLYNKKKKPKQ